jgi:hypothetical protein
MLVEEAREGRGAETTGADAAAAVPGDVDAIIG